MTKFKSITCACGASFQREVKRGRPQVWCPACVETPFVQRNKVAEVVVEESERVRNENDPLDSVRADIEAGMSEINAAHKVRFAALVASGVSPWDAGEKATQETYIATTNLYAQHRPNKKPIGGVALDD